MSRDIVPFDFNGQQLRALTVDGEPWFLAFDVAAILKLGNISSSLAKLDDDERGLHSMETPSGLQSFAIVSEPGLYSLILRSRRPEAKAFKRWVTHEVIPSIRKTGSYSVPGQRWDIDPESVDREALALLILASERAKKAAEAQASTLRAELAIAAPAATSWEAIVNTGADYSMARAAKMLAADPAISRMKIGRDDLFNTLSIWKWIYREGDPDAGPWTIYQRSVETGRLRERPQFHRHPKTNHLVKDAPQVRVTLKGLSDIQARLLTKAGQLAIEGA